MDVAISDKTDAELVSYSADSSQLSVIIPAKNEARSISAVLTALAVELPRAEFFLVLNATTDNTETLAAQTAASYGINLAIINLKEGGKGRAMRTGAQYAARPWLLFHDADLEYSIADAAALTAYGMAQGPGVITIGERLTSLGQVRISSFLANQVTRLLFTARPDAAKLKAASLPPDLLSGTRLISRNAFQAMTLDDIGFSIETAIAREALAAGLALATYPIHYAPRTVAEGRHIRPRHLLPIITAALRKPLSIPYVPDANRAKALLSSRSSVGLSKQNPR